MSRYLVITVLVVLAVVAFMAKHRSAGDTQHLTPSHQDACERLAHYLDPESKCPL